MFQQIITNDLCDNYVIQNVHDIQGPIIGLILPIRNSEKRRHSVFEIELEVGSVLVIGETVLTIVEIDDDDVTFKIDSTDGDEDLIVTISQESLRDNDSSSSIPALPR